jgi:hypothetical protein
MKFLSKAIELRKTRKNAPKNDFIIRGILVSSFRAGRFLGAFLNVLEAFPRKGPAAFTQI